MLVLWAILACRPEPAETETADFDHQMIQRGVRPVTLVDQETGQPIYGAVVAVQDNDSGQLLARAVASDGGEATLRLSVPSSRSVSLVGIHPDYEIARQGSDAIASWLNGGAPLSLSMEPR